MGEVGWLVTGAESPRVVAIPPAGVVMFGRAPLGFQLTMTEIVLDHPEVSPRHAQLVVGAASTLAGELHVVPAADLATTVVPARAAVLVSATDTYPEDGLVTAMRRLADDEVRVWFADAEPPERHYGPTLAIRTRSAS